MSTGTIQSLPAGGTSGQIQLIDPPTDPNGNISIAYDIAPSGAVMNSAVTFDIVASGRSFIAENVQLPSVATGIISSLPAGGTSGQIQLVSPATDPNGNTFISFDIAPTGAGIGNNVSFNIVQSGRSYIAQDVKLLESGPADEGVIRTGVITGGLRISNGQVITLSAATVSGDVQLEGGKLIIKKNSKINGKIEGEHHVELLIYDSIVVGDMDVTNSLKIDLFHSNFSHNVDLENNTTVSVANCTIGGKLKLANNSNQINTGNTVHG